ncbi:MAG: GGDEF domain-containing protein [Synergistaceae bacterium]|nr:GGDEF domain-containing protein [Synergistaceae bacterium]
MRSKSSLITLFIMLSFAPSAFADASPSDISSASYAPASLTFVERRYVKEHPVISAATFAGTAPLAYLEDGELFGITRGLLDEISRQTGFKFKYSEASNIKEGLSLIKRGEVDILACVPRQHINGPLLRYPVSKPYLYSTSVLFIRNGVDPSNRFDKVYAAVMGVTLPSDVNPNKVKYYNGREAALDAVESGAADYCYANEFSVAYYTIKNGYRRAMSVPRKMESREYLVVYINTDKTFVSIINKALGAISPMKMQRIIIDGSLSVEPKVTLSRVLYTYGKELLAIMALILAALISLSAIAVYSMRESRKHIRRLMLLSGSSTEYIYEYDISNDILIPTENCGELLNIYSFISGYRKTPGHSLIMSDGLDLVDGNEREVSLGKKGFFRIINSVVNDKHGKPEYIVGKLIDISEEKEQIKELQHKSEMDGLTGIYNSETARNMVCSRREKAPNLMAALFVIDIDKFKNINDTYGHYIGDCVLKSLSASLTAVFRESDIVGRIGGDEFCAFIDGNVTEEIVNRKCELLRKQFKTAINDGRCPASVTLSIGVLLGCDPDMPFDSAYRKADEALYYVKENGRDGYKIVTA